MKCDERPKHIPLPTPFVRHAKHSARVLQHPYSSSLQIRYVPTRAHLRHNRELKAKHASNPSHSVSIICYSLEPSSSHHHHHLLLLLPPYPIVSLIIIHM